jgi:hypothetical protein
VAGERADVEPAVVHRHRHRLEPGHRDRPAVQPEARVLDSDPPCAAAAQRPAGERQPLREPGADQHPLRRRRYAADAAEVRAER